MMRVRMAQQNEKYYQTHMDGDNMGARRHGSPKLTNTDQWINTQEAEIINAKDRVKANKKRSKSNE